jgi:2-methylisocitrate lyase-like PEP mutase family enzyme
MTQRSKAELLLRLHGGPAVLVFPNAWDALSARIVEAEGYPAVATTSAGCAAVLGYQDGQQIPRSEMVFLLAKIVNAVHVPVTADMEAGYDDVEQTALDLITAGAVGLNFEDMIANELLPMATQVERIRLLRIVAFDSGIPLVINARTDIFLAQHGDEATRLSRSVERLNAFRAAGADCLFAPGVSDAETIRKLVREIDGPVNILAVPGSPSIPELKDMGVARVSMGSGASRVAMGAFRSFAHELREHGTFGAMSCGAMSSGAVSYAEAQSMLARRK